MRCTSSCKEMKSSRCGVVGVLVLCGRLRGGVVFLGGKGVSRGGVCYVCAAAGVCDPAGAEWWGGEHLCEGGEGACVVRTAAGRATQQVWCGWDVGACRGCAYPVRAVAGGATQQVRCGWGVGACVSAPAARVSP